jgi:hypothetical protein
MDEQRQQRINEAARQFTEALVGSYRAVSERGVSVQEHNAELTQNFFNRVIENLRAQAEGTRAMTQRLADQQQRQRESAQALTRESVSVYMDFVNSMFSFWRGSVEAAGRSTGETVEKSAAETSRGAREAETQTRVNGGLPLEEYDSLNVDQKSERLDQLSIEELEQLRDYETENKNRRTLVERLNQGIEAGSS